MLSLFTSAAAGAAALVRVWHARHELLLRHLKQNAGGNRHVALESLHGRAY